MVHLKRHATCVDLNHANWKTHCPSIPPDESVLFLGDSIASQVYAAYSCQGERATYRWYNLKTDTDDPLAHVAPGTKVITVLGTWFKVDQLDLFQKAFAGFVTRVARAPHLSFVLLSNAAQHWVGGEYNNASVAACHRTGRCGDVNDARRYRGYEERMLRVSLPPNARVLSLYNFTRRWVHMHPAGRPNAHQVTCDCTHFCYRPAEWTPVVRALKDAIG